MDLNERLAAAKAARGTDSAKHPLVYATSFTVDGDDCILRWSKSDMAAKLHDPKPNKDGKIGNSQVVTINVPGGTVDGVKCRGGNLTLGFPLG